MKSGPEKIPPSFWPRGTRKSHLPNGNSSCVILQAAITCGLNLRGRSTFRRLATFAVWLSVCAMSPFFVCPRSPVVVSSIALRLELGRRASLGCDPTELSDRSLVSPFDPQWNRCLTCAAPSARPLSRIRVVERPRRESLPPSFVDVPTRLGPRNGAAASFRARIVGERRVVQNRTTGVSERHCSISSCPLP
jgi:hypothetical protein